MNIVAGEGYGAATILDECPESFRSVFLMLGRRVGVELALILLSIPAILGVGYGASFVGVLTTER